MARLVEPDLDQVLAFCAEDPVERVFLEDLARRGLGRFTGLECEDGQLRGLCHVGANLGVSGSGSAAFEQVARRGRARMLIGEERCVGELWEAARWGMPAPREDRPGQPVYELRSPPEPGDSGLRRAKATDFDLLLPACAATHLEELGVDPLVREPDGFRWRTQAQIEEGRSWLWEEDGTILFKAEASAWTPSAVQLQQVWVDPEARGNHYAQRGMRDLCRLLLERAPVICLFVRRENTVAQHVYEAIGMVRTIAYRSVLF